jgi:DNA-binding GntR family transcriptional regulator
MMTRRPIMKDKLQKKMRRGDHVAHIYDSLRSRIISMALPPGALIDEAAILREFRVSRTPVREAIVRLGSEGLVVLLPNKGSQVAPLDIARIRDYLEASRLIQPFVTVLAAKRRTKTDLLEIEAATVAFEEAVQVQDGEAMVMRNRDYHAAIARSCGNELLSAAYTRLLDEALRIARFTLNDHFYTSAENHRSFVDKVVAEHRQMLNAIEQRDIDTAETVATIHTEHVRVRFSEFLGENIPPRR